MIIKLCKFSGMWKEKKYMEYMEYMLQLFKSISISSTHCKPTLIHKKSPVTKTQPLLQWNLKAAKKTKQHCK